MLPLLTEAFAMAPRPGYSGLAHERPSTMVRYYVPSDLPPPPAPAAIIQIAPQAKVLETFYKPHSVILDV